MYVNVFFVIRCLYSTVSLTLVREQRFIRIICYYYYHHYYYYVVPNGNRNLADITTYQLSL